MYSSVSQAVVYHQLEQTEWGSLAKFGWNVVKKLPTPLTACKKINMIFVDQINLHNFCYFVYRKYHT